MQQLADYIISIPNQDGFRVMYRFRQNVLIVKIIVDNAGGIEVTLTLECYCESCPLKSDKPLSRFTKPPLIVSMRISVSSTLNRPHTNRVNSIVGFSLGLAINSTRGYFGHVNNILI